MREEGRPETQRQLNLCLRRAAEHVGFPWQQGWEGWGGGEQGWERWGGWGAHLASLHHGCASPHNPPDRAPICGPQAESAPARLQLRAPSQV